MSHKETVLIKTQDDTGIWAHIREYNQFFSKHELGNVCLFYAIIKLTSPYNSSHYLKRNENVPIYLSTFTSIQVYCTHLALIHLLDCLL
jgi:hypothetical protein